jgi:hypothetical protein
LIGIAKSMGWCDRVEETVGADTTFRSCIVILKSAPKPAEGGNTPTVLTHMVFDKDKDALLKEIRETMARNMEEEVADAVYNSETL